MKHFIGIVPPEDIYNAVFNIQKQFGDNRLEPHITLRPPVIVTDEEAWITAIEQVCKSFSPFEIALPGTGNFGKRVLFIDVKSEAIDTLHYSIMEAVKPFEQPELKQQGQSFNPHLTLGRSWCGFTPQHFIEMRKLANGYLSAKPVSFDSKFVRVYHKSPGHGRYKILKDIPLAQPEV
jgi:2'-5' RNA ligase